MRSAAVRPWQADDRLGKWVEYLLDAEARCEAVAPITDADPDLTLEDAYRIQDELLARRIARRGAAGGGQAGPDVSRQAGIDGWLPADLRLADGLGWWSRWRHRSRSAS